MIIVTGANGQFGRQVVDHLLRRVPAERVGVSVRDPRRADGYARRGVRVRRGDFTDPASLADAFEGATQVLVVSVDRLGDEAVRQHRAAIDAAVAAGARRILYTSHQAAGTTSRFRPGRDHAATEEALRHSGIAYTSLRNGFYASSGLAYFGDAGRTGTLDLPADGPVSWTDRADLAEAAAVLLADEGRYDGPTPPLTAADAYTYAELAALASELTGRTVSRGTVTDERFRDAMVERGVPAGMAGELVGMFAAARDGEFTAVDPTLGELLGRAPTPMRTLLAQHLAQSE